MGREYLPCTWRSRYSLLETNPCAMPRQQGVDRFAMETAVTAAYIGSATRKV
jgi:hypothetical protein